MWLILESGRHPRRLTAKEICSDRPRRRIAERTRLDRPRRYRLRAADTEARTAPSPQASGALAAACRLRSAGSWPRARPRRKTTSAQHRRPAGGRRRPRAPNPARAVANPTRLRRHSSTRNDRVAVSARRRPIRTATGVAPRHGPLPTVNRPDDGTWNQQAAWQAATCRTSCGTGRPATSTTGSDRPVNRGRPRGTAPKRPRRLPRRPRPMPTGSGPTTWCPHARCRPSRGWRLALYKATFGLVNLGPSPDEIRQAELESKIKSVLRGHYKVGVMGKGGVGKTTVSASVGSVFAELRQDDRVVAIDADTAFGKLGSRVDPKAQGSYWELASDQHLETFADSAQPGGQQRRRPVRAGGRGDAGAPPRTGPRDLSGSDVAAGPLLHDLDHRLQLDHGHPRHPGGAAGSRRADRRVLAVGRRRGRGRSDDGLAGRPRD